MARQLFKKLEQQLYFQHIATDKPRMIMTARTWITRKAPYSPDSRHRNNIRNVHFTQIDAQYTHQPEQIPSSLEALCCCKGLLQHSSVSLPTRIGYGQQYKLSMADRHASHQIGPDDANSNPTILSYIAQFLALLQTRTAKGTQQMLNQNSSTNCW